MRQLAFGILCVLFVIGVAGASAAGMMDTLKGKAEEAKETTTEAQKDMDMKDVGKNQAIEAKDATKQEAGGMIDQLKEGAKGEVDKTGKTVDETIDNIGK